jgi:hypothetical protein
MPAIERFHFVDLRHITRLEPIEGATTPKGRNGKKS